MNIVDNPRLWTNFAFRTMHILGVVAVGGYNITKAFFMPSAEMQANQ